MAERLGATSERPSTTPPMENPLMARVAVCSECRKLPDCFGRLVCPTRDRG